MGLSSLRHTSCASAFALAPSLNWPFVHEPYVPLHSGVGIAEPWCRAAGLMREADLLHGAFVYEPYVPCISACGNLVAARLAAAAVPSASARLVQDLH